MAKQTGLTRYSGTMGGVRHFKIKGLEGDFAGLAGGPTEQQIKTAPEFARTRENMSEFGGCAKAGKSVRVGLSQLMSTMADPQVAGRLTAVMKTINLEDTGHIRGQRSVLVSTNRPLLENFQFNVNISFDTAMFAPYTLTNVVARNAAQIDVPIFEPLNYLTIPTGATHFRIIHAISVVSDWAYDTVTKKYKPTQPTLNGKKDVEYSAYLPINAATPLVTLNPSLAGAPVMTADVSVLSCVGIEFYQQVGADYYVFSSGNALKIGVIF